LAKEGACPKAESGDKEKDRIKKIADRITGSTGYKKK